MKVLRIEKLIRSQDRAGASGDKRKRQSLTGK